MDLSTADVSIARHSRGVASRAAVWRPAGCIARPWVVRGQTSVTWKRDEAERGGTPFATLLHVRRCLDRDQDERGGRRAGWGGSAVALRQHVGSEHGSHDLRWLVCAARKKRDTSRVE